jgi:hypothetical protein
MAYGLITLLTKFLRPRWRVLCMSSIFTIGATVRLIALPAYVKTAEPKPMLRPPQVIQLGEEGIVIDRRPGNYWGVKFANGVFLMEAQYLAAVAPIDGIATSTAAKSQTPSSTPPSTAAPNSAHRSPETAPDADR